MDMREKLARALTRTLRHHGVEMHPDDIRGLAWDILTALREPTEEMVEAAKNERMIIPPETLPGATFRRMFVAAIDAARGGEG